MFARVGRFVVRHPVWVILAWVVVAAALIGFAPKLTSTSDEASFLPTHYESIQAMELQQQAFPQAATPAALIVFQRSDSGKLTDDDSTKVNEIAQALTGDSIANVTAIAATPASQNKLVQIIAVQMVQVTRRAQGGRTAGPQARDASAVRGPAGVLRAVAQPADAHRGAPVPRRLRRVPGTDDARRQQHVLVDAAGIG